MKYDEFENKLKSGSFDEVLISLYGAEALEKQKNRYLAAAEAFTQLYPDREEFSVFSAPGRTEIGGNHTDHQHGCVLAAAVDIDVIAVVGFHNDGIIRVKSNGYPEDYLKMHYTCPLCQDTGYVDNRKCICFRRAISEHLYTQSNIRELLKTASFDAFSLDYYPEDMVNEATGQTARQSAATALQRSKDFVQNFDHSFENLFIYGDTGVGKTFLTYCIAKELLDSMHSVIYYSAFDLFDAFARNTFSNSDTTEGENDYILNCDLLIIDDLGTELTNSFVASQFFLCINERILRKKSTVISTNLTLGSFMDTYSERVFSRVSSNYTMIKLIGKDIRIQKKILGGN